MDNMEKEEKGENRTLEHRVPENTTMAPSRRLELRGLVLLGAIGLGGAAMTPTPARQCQMVLDLWCAGDGECTRDVARDGDTVPLVARHNLPKLAGGVMAGWKCFSPSTLDKTEQRYVGGVDFCSRPVLANVLDICDGTNATAAAYPAPPQCTGGAGPTPSSGGDPGAPYVHPGLGLILDSTHLLAGSI